MKDKLSDEQTATILKALDEALQQGPWDASNFLRVLGKSLKEIRDAFADLASPEKERSKINAHLANRIAMRAGQQEIFISLYASDGGSIQAWERIVNNLPKQMTSRPIYASEEDVKAMIRVKENKLNEGYVSIYINQSDILPTAPDKTPTDKLGVPLLTLKDKTVKVENINQFVHKSGIYNYVSGRLVKIPPGESS